MAAKRRRPADELQNAKARVVTDALLAEPSWNARVQLIRQIPETFGRAELDNVYARVAERVYVPALKADFAYVHWRKEYELAPHVAIYDRAHELTDGFTKVGVEDLTRTLTAAPATVAVFRLILGLIGRDFADLCAIVAKERGLKAGAPATKAIAIDMTMRGAMFPPTPAGSDLRLKLDKPDTRDGWDSVRMYAAGGVPYSMFLHQRAYGGAFRQLLDATGTKRGDVLEEPVEALFKEARVPYIRTGSDNQGEIEQRFGLTVKPAPDFVVYDRATNTLRTMLECKGANDGGTARDKAGLFFKLHTEANRLGVHLFAVLGGLGWRRVGDALGPVVRDTDGRTFTVATLPEMLSCEPFPTLIGTAPPADAELGHSPPS